MIAFPSSGNEEQDEAFAADYRRSQSCLDRGLCPNDGVTPLRDIGTHEECPACGFTYFR